jgi:glutamyl-tRNA reductase
MALIAAGISHRTAPIEARERCVVGGADVASVLDAVRGAAGAREAVVLSTCNRTEFYLVEGATDAAETVWRTLSARLGADATRLGYVRRDRDAVRHLMRVAAGLDAMVLGEAQIQGQVRDAWELSRTRSGPMLNRLFQTALAVAGRVRTETAIGRGAGSVPSAAVLLARKIFGSLAGRRAMVLGAGEMAELALERLMAEGMRTALVANRTFARAEALARRHGATAVPYDECWAGLADVDVLVCSTAAPHPIVVPALLAPTLRERGGRPLCILDVALPRDVDPRVAALDNVFLYDIDDLRAVVSVGIEQRRSEVPTAEQLIDGEVEKYWQWLAGLAAVPVVTDVRAAMERLRAHELAQLVRKLGSLSAEQHDVIEHFSRSLMNKFLHEPSVRLRAAAANGRGLGVVDAARYLFGVERAGDGGALRAPAPSDGGSDRGSDEGSGPPASGRGSS